MVADRYLTYVLSSAIKERVLKRSVESRGEGPGKQPGPVASCHCQLGRLRVQYDRYCTRIRSHGMPGIGPHGRSDRASTSSSIDLN
jgi:hypothetical protein